MTITKLFPSGMWEISDIVNGQYIRRRYEGYTKKEAIQNFREEMKGEKS